MVEQSGMEDASPEEMRQAMEAWSRFDNEASEAGALIACEPLEPAATTIHLREDQDPVVTDGPFADTKEQLGGFCVLECRDLAEAGSGPQGPNRSGAIEIRPVMDLSGFGYHSKTLTPANAAA